jgi:YD repeat-containing protein
MKKILIVFGFLLLGSVLSAQTGTSFGYDASGNRTSRTIVLRKKSAPKSTNDSVNPKAKSAKPELLAAGADLQSEPFTDTSAPATEDETSEPVYTDKLKESDVLIYPNPTQGALAVEIRNMNPKVPYQLQVFSMSGATVFERTNVSNYTAIDLSARPQGVYVLRISAGDSFVTWKIIKE